MSDRIARRLLDSDVTLERDRLIEAGMELLAEEAPLAGRNEVQRAVDDIVGLGPIEALLRDPEVSDVLVNGDGRVWLERRGELAETDVAFAGPAAVIAAIERVIAPLGLRIDRASPAVDARLPDGSRLHALVPPASVDGPVLAVRRFTEAVRNLDEMVEAGALDGAAAGLLRAAVGERKNIIVSGPTGAGKTTVLNVLSKEIPDTERVVTVEDAAELRMVGHVVRLETRPPNSEGAGAIDLPTLVRHALRLRPDRIVVGEVRGSEAFDMVQAMSTGHSGSMSTVHSEDAAEAVWRIETLATAGRHHIREDTVRRQLRSALDLVVHVARAGARRIVAEIAAVTSEGTEVVWRSMP